MSGAWSELFYPFDSPPDGPGGTVVLSSGPVLFISRAWVGTMRYMAVAGTTCLAHVPAAFIHNVFLSCLYCYERIRPASWHNKPTARQGNKTATTFILGMPKVLTKLAALFAFNGWRFAFSAQRRRLVSSSIGAGRFCGMMLPGPFYYWLRGDMPVEKLESVPPATGFQSGCSFFLPRKVWLF